MNVKQLEELRPELVLVHDSQDVEEICTMIKADSGKWKCLFVEVLNGEYGDVFAIENLIPHYNLEVTQISYKAQMYCIQCVNNPDLFWSNDWGWGDEDVPMTLFSEEEKNKVQLPVEGKWKPFN